jgi:beta-1,4-mannosyltransferase
MYIDLGIVLPCLLGLFALWFTYQTFWKPVEPPSYRTVAIVVLGDIGRSPRMMYHAESFASHDFNAYIIAYKGTPASSCISGGGSNK